MDITTDPVLLDVELPHTLIESSSISTFLPDEEASICPLLSHNSISAQLTSSHPLIPSVHDDATASVNLNNMDCKLEDNSSSESSTGRDLVMEAEDSVSANLFNKRNYQQLQNNNNNFQQNGNGNCLNGGINHSRNAPCFVSWNWPLIRKCTFFLFISALFAMCSIVLAMIVMLPKTCNPKTAWYRGSVFYEIFPASFQDSNDDGIGDIRGIRHRIEYIASLGITAIRLNSIFSSPHYPEDFINATTITDVSHLLGNMEDILDLSKALHQRNMKLLLDLPVNKFLKSNKANVLVNDSKVNLVSDAIQLWIKMGVDGFYLKGLEDNEGFNIKKHIKEWKSLIGPNRILIISDKFVNGLSSNSRAEVLLYIDLLDVHLNIINGTKNLQNRIQRILNEELPPSEDKTWIHWSLEGKKRLSRGINRSKYLLAATIMQLMLPGTPNIFYGDQTIIENDIDILETSNLLHLGEKGLSNVTDQLTNEKTLSSLLSTVLHDFNNLEVIKNMIHLRERSPSIYKNIFCKANSDLQNTQIIQSKDIIIIERTYPRRNSFVSVTNLGLKQVTLDMTAMFYSGIRMLGNSEDQKIYFKNFVIDSTESIVVKLDK